MFKRHLCSHVVSQEHDEFLSQVFEHVPRPYVAHAEVYRVLRPGGRHVFTTPVYEQSHDVAYAKLDEDGVLWYRAEQSHGLRAPMLHGDPVHKGGALVYTIHGTKEMPARLGRMGFEVSGRRIFDPKNGVVCPSGVFTFTLRKPQQKSPSNVYAAGAAREKQQG